MKRIFEIGASIPWAIVPSNLETMIDIADRLNSASPETLEAYRAEQSQNGERMRVRDGVAILSVEGPLFKKANLFVAMSGATSYEILRRDLQAALDDPEVSGIMLNVSSPGGEAFGCDEIAQAVYAARGKKPIHAYVSGQACSGGYWIASAAENVTVSDIALLGSIGVIMGMEKRGSDNARGVERFEFVSSQSPGKRPDPADKKGSERIQKTVDDMAQVFVDAVAKHRGVTAETVIKQFGGGGVLVGANAVKAGMVDAVGQFEDALSALPKRTKQAPAGNQSGQSPGPRWPDLSGAAAQAAEAPVDEKDRCKTILTSPDGLKHSPLAQHLAFNTDVSTAQAMKILEIFGSEATARTSQELTQTADKWLEGKRAGGALVDVDGAEHMVSGGDSDEIWDRVIRKANQ